MITATFEPEFPSTTPAELCLNPVVLMRKIQTKAGHNALIGSNEQAPSSMETD